MFLHLLMIVIRKYVILEKSLGRAREKIIILRWWNIIKISNGRINSRIRVSNTDPESNHATRSSVAFRRVMNLIDQISL